MPSEVRNRRPMVIGVGTDARSDDGAGLEVVRALRERRPFAAELLEAPSELSELLDRWASRPLVILVDATRSRAAPGTIHRWSGNEVHRLPLQSSLSSHGLPLPTVVELGRQLGRNPDRIVVYGIEAQETGPGYRRSPPVQAAIPLVCDRIAEEIESEAVEDA